MTPGWSNPPGVFYLLTEQTNRHIAGGIENGGRATKLNLGNDMEWQPIETAPKDGSVIIVNNHGIDIGYWSAAYNGWLTGGSLTIANPTHWLPAPELPTDD